MTWGYVAVGVGTLAGGYLASQGAKSAANTAAGAANGANAISDAQFQQTRTDSAPWRNAGGSAIGQLSYLLGLPGYEPKPQNTLGTQQLSTIGMKRSGKWENMLPTEAQISATNDGSNFDYNPTTGEWTPAVTQGGTYNTQLGDFGSLSRDFSTADFQADPGYQFRMDAGQKALERSAAAGGRALGGGTLKALTRYGQDFGSQEYDKAFNRFQTNRNTRFNQLAAVAGIGQTANGQLAQLGAQNATTQGNNLMGAATVGGNAALAGAAGWSTALNNGVNNWLTYSGYKK